MHKTRKGEAIIHPGNNFSTMFLNVWLFMLKKFIDGHKVLTFALLKRTFDFSLQKFDLRLIIMVSGR